MVNKTISIPYDLYKKLQEEANASKLITELLDVHYGNTDKRSDEEIIDEVKQKIIDREEAEAKREERVRNLINTTRDIFGVELSEAQAKEYLADANCKSISDYLQCQGLCTKEELTESEESDTSS